MRQWKAILLVAATYVGTVIGAGFATGKEIVTFFSQFGIAGTFSVLISSFLFIWLGSKMMILAARLDAYSYKQFNESLFGKTCGKIFNGLLFVIVISVTSVMLSGAGAIFNEQLGLSYLFGIILTVLLCYVVVMFGLNGLMAINAYIVPFIFIMGIFIFFSVFDGRADLLYRMFSFTEIASPWKAWASPFAYAAFNLVTALVVLVPLGREIKDETVLRWGSFIGGLVLCIILLVSHFSLTANPSTFSFNIPMAEIVEPLGRLIHMLFLMIIFGEIFNTVVANVFGVARQLETSLHLKYQHAVLIVLFIIICISQINYGKLLTTLYPLFGYFGLCYLSILLIKRTPPR